VIGLLVVSILANGCSRKPSRQDPACKTVSAFFEALASGDASRAAAYWRFESPEDNARYMHQFKRWSDTLREADIVKVRYYSIEATRPPQETTSSARAEQADVDLVFRFRSGQETTGNVFGLEKSGKSWRINGFVRMLGGSAKTREVRPADASRLVASTNRFLWLLRRGEHRRAYDEAGLAGAQAGIGRGHAQMRYKDFVRQSRLALGEYSSWIPVSVSAGDWTFEKSGYS